jgi:kynurenine 3-monooxygenase
VSNITIIGAGLCGSLLAVRLAQRGHRVSLYEKRSDLRKTGAVSGRSINLALSDRGLLALRMIGVEDAVRPLCIPMTGRMVHPLGQLPVPAPYSGRQGEYINSVSRGGLNAALLDVAEAHSNIQIQFDADATAVNLDTGTATFVRTGTQESFTVASDVLIGTDGAGSVLRRSMMARTGDLLFNYSQEFLRHGYKELSIPATPSGGFALEKNALHIWPRGTYMVIALPNLDGSFTVTVFLPFHGEYGFLALQDAAKARAFFAQQFPDVLALIPAFETEWADNPTGNLGIIKCYPWQAFGKTLLMGDAAHAIVPFYGQGMNASFEDVSVLDGLLDQYGDDQWPAVLEAFQDARKPDADAIADLATDNFYEMRDHVANPVFQRKRRLETQLEQRFPDYFSKYSLVTFRADVPYRQAMEQGRRQDTWLMDFCAASDTMEWDLEAVRKRMREEI